MRTDMIICQVFIFIFGASAVWLVGRTEHWKRWGYINGLCGGPFWLYMAAVNNQWGVFALSLWYSFSWGQGVWNYWIKPWKMQRNLERNILNQKVDESDEAVKYFNKKFQQNSDIPKSRFL